jgi:hypothetical protein
VDDGVVVNIKENEPEKHTTDEQFLTVQQKKKLQDSGITGSIVLNKLLMLDNILNVLPRTVRGRRLGTAIVETVTHTQTC